jgi:hypothetical protein
MVGVYLLTPENSFQPSLIDKFASALLVICMVLVSGICVTAAKNIEKTAIKEFSGQ